MSSPRLRLRSRPMVVPWPVEEHRFWGAMSAGALWALTAQLQSSLCRPHQIQALELPEAGEGASTQTSDASDNLKTAEQGPGEAAPPQEEPVDFEQLPLLKPYSDRVYRRPSRNREQPESSGTAETSAGVGASISAVAPVNSSSSTGAASSSQVKPAAGRGRVRDYTVLHPSCVSVCNVTIQDSMDRSMDELVNTTPADLGEAGTFRRKADSQAAKPTR
ncbi:hypothetical protein SRHO_G00128380 [Serrasalmus rhombeus]